MIRFFNTLSGKLEEFKPLKAGEVGMYTCGPTVYDFAHIGNFRAFVFEDLLRRFLEFKGFRVKHCMNITDVDDKTIAGAKREGKKLDEFTAQYTQAFHEDSAALNILPPNHPPEQPRATREIPAMIELIEKLVKKEMAYASEGSVYYRAASFPSYGKLSKKKLEKNVKGARIERDEYTKEEISDFALWKKSKEGEPAWDSPWGKGRPGWHVECSAMSMKYLGETFDIHAGGEDLIFPHHENEIAQSEGATGEPFVRTWLHCRFLLVNGEKMSKSKGNFYTLRDLLTKGYDPMAIRYALLSVHYRSPLNFTLQGLEEAGESIKKLDECYADCLSLFHNPDFASSRSGEDFDTSRTSLPERIKDVLEGINLSLEEDLNISSALSHFLIGVHFMNQALGQRKTSKEHLQLILHFFKEMDRLFGFDIAEVDSVPQEVMRAVKERDELRRRKDFSRTDALRDEIQKQGWFVKDGRPGEPSTVKKKRRVWD